MATPAASPAVAAPEGLTPKARRAWEFLGEHERRMAERRGGLLTYHCGSCGVRMYEYVPPIGMHVERCRECGTWQKFTTER